MACGPGPGRSPPRKGGQGRIAGIAAEGIGGDPTLGAA
jgi:hypothetical protein